MAKKALILGITGQDGSYLAEILLEKGYEVHGFIRRTSTGNTKNIEHLLDKVTLHRGDMLDATSLYRAIQESKPEEIYNEADQDHAGWSFNAVDYQMNITGSAPARVLEIIRQLNPKIKYFQPITSNIFGKAENPQTEETPFRPQSPYACAKVLAYVLSRFYRETYGMFVSTGIFYNHESPRRPEEYVTRKISRAAAKIKLGLQDKLELGDMSIKIDWGYSKEYMEAAWNILQLEKPDDFIICTGEAHSVQEFVDEAFGVVGLDPKKYVGVNPKFLRPGVNTTLIGDISKAKKAFGFDPKVKFKELVRIMVEADLDSVKHHASSVKKHGA
ncbi:MAG: GDP-mannose 4,6-dehydratase [Candidatus Liptonbacteria bacterium]|nr:GDP-mannose 4,6-dehydratase [Parcubacteria group bacterium]MBI4087335.1 GDP-mannose 4,6-dehydratase [Candidatus Liptonbacteria bacterium]